MPDLSAQMDAVCHRFEELSVRLNQPDAAADPALFRKLMRDYHETQPVVQAYRDWQTARDHLAQAKALLEEPISDPDFKQMIQQEISEKSQDVAKLENNLKILLLPRDPRDEKNVIMEIRGGAGGEEAALFAHSLLRMYTMYAAEPRLDAGTAQPQRDRAGRREGSQSFRWKGPGPTTASSTRAGCTGCSACPRPRPRAASTPPPPRWP